MCLLALVPSLCVSHLTSSGEDLIRFIIRQLSQQLSSDATGRSKDALAQISDPVSCGPGELCYLRQTCPPGPSALVGTLYREKR